MDNETGLKMCAEMNGINWDEATWNMLDGDIDAAAKQLRYAKSAKSEADRLAVLGWLKLCEAGRSNGR